MNLSSVEDLQMTGKSVAAIGRLCDMCLSYEHKIEGCGETPSHLQHHVSGSTQLDTALPNVDAPI
jgi:hypothetical protein